MGMLSACVRALHHSHGAFIVAGSDALRVHPDFWGAGCFVRLITWTCPCIDASPTILLLSPVQFVWGVAFIIASIFFGVVEMAVDTVLLSFCEDCEENGGVPRYAPPLLMDALTRHAKALDDEDAQKKAQLELELAKLNRPRA
jgi:hypothetical protein